MQKSMTPDRHPRFIRVRVKEIKPTPNLVERYRALIQNQEGQILLIRRSQQEKWRQGYWELPGGKREPHQTPFEALRDEVLQETGFTIEENPTLLHQEKGIFPEGHRIGQPFKIATYKVTIKGGVLTLSEEHDSSMWLTIENALKIEKTDGYMNESGKSVKKLVDFYHEMARSSNKVRGSYKVSFDDLFVAYDDLDIPVGSFKIHKDGGPRVHNGVNSVRDSLGSNDFWHVRIGVDGRDKNPPAGGEYKQSLLLRSRIKGEEYVLQDFSKDEVRVLKEVFEAVSKELKEKHGWI